MLETMPQGNLAEQQLTHAEVYAQYAQDPNANPDLLAHMQRLADAEAQTVTTLESDAETREAGLPDHEITPEHHQKHIKLAEPMVADIHERPSAEQDMIGEVIELGEAAVEDAAEDQQADKATGIPEFDRLDDYTPEFAEQILMHRSNAELSEDDIILPSNQISSEMHEQLNGKRGFTSTSSPRGSAEFYDAKLAHAGTRDFGKIYGDYLYEVEPLEGDTLKWGENFGADVNRKKRAESPAIDTRVDAKPATTDSYTGKQHNEVVSTKGFRVVRKIPHEPTYDEAMLPWPVSQEAIAKHQARNENRLSNVAPKSSDTTPGYGQAFPILRTTARKRPDKMGGVDMPGTYRAFADERNPAEWRTKFDAMKQQTEYPGQPALPGMSMSKYGDPNRWEAREAPLPVRPERPGADTPLPGMPTPDEPPQF